MASNKPRLLSYNDFQTAGLIHVAIACGESMHTWRYSWEDILGSAIIMDDEEILYNTYVEWFNRTYGNRMEKLKDEQIKDRVRTVGNEVYASVHKAVHDQEPRGFNAHHVAQEVCEAAKKAVQECLQRYRSYIKCCPDEDLEPNTTMQFMVCQKCGWTSKDPNNLPPEPADLY